MIEIDRQRVRCASRHWYVGTICDFQQAQKSVSDPALGARSKSGQRRLGPGRLVRDWEAHYARQPWLLETLVDRRRYAGTCYRAATWVALGETSGRGREDRHHRRHGAEPKSKRPF
jgi:hypothetical protein